ncbi:hypothetical protein TNCV_5115091 [Trichonephila clavipes]|nr:hypothetical protein TNCV_5115091 [Trichonephila clavipes]
MPSVVNSDFEVKNQGLISARSAEVKLPTLSLTIFSGVTEEWLAFSDLIDAAVSNNNDLTVALSSLFNYLRAFGDGPVAGVPGDQGIQSWLACLEFERSATKEPPCRAAMRVKSIES